MKLLGYFGAAWGIGGVCLLLIYALYRLLGIVIDAFALELHWYHWLVLIANMLFMAYSEGYRGFQLGFSPRVAARAKHLLHHPKWLHVCLAPLFCMGYFHATRKRLISTYVLFLGILMFILVFQQISQPWRGILDVGVVVGLIWGVISLIGFFFQAMLNKSFNHSPELPEK